MAKAKINIYDVATNALCGMLEEAGKDWKKPWKYTRSWRLPMKASGNKGQKSA